MAELLILLGAALVFMLSMSWLNLKSRPGPLKVLTYALLWTAALTSATALAAIVVRVYNG